MSNQSGENIFGLLVVSDELLLEELFQYIQNHLIEKETGWIQQNSILIMKTIFNLPNYEKLMHCIASNPLPIFSSDDFLSLDKDILFSLLKRDDLKIGEIIIWDSLIKWGIGQIPELKNINNNRDKWTNKNYEDLKNTLRNFIPLIRFYNITSDNFYDKVHPYERIIQNNIYKEAMSCYLVEEPKLLNCIKSEIIKPRLVSIIANWIVRSDSNVLSINNKYKFNLIYKKSQDGLDYVTFHKKCNGQGPFVILIKVQSNKIYGGYNPIGFASRKSQWLSTSDSFIFSFENERDMHNMKIGRVINKTKSVWESCNRTFISFGRHLCIRRQNLIILRNRENYDNIFNIDINSQVALPIEEIEVFSIVKK